MCKTRYLLVLIPLLIIVVCNAQEKPAPVIIHKKVETVEYSYQDVYLDYFTSFHFSANYPNLIIREISSRQKFFEQGRNLRLGYQLGMEQGLKLGDFSLALGIDYLIYNEYFSCFEYEIRQVIIQQMDGTPRNITVASGNPVQKSYDNRLDYLVLPLSFGYFPEKLNNKAGIILTGKYHYLLSSNYNAKFSLDEPARLIEPREFNRSLYSFQISMIYNQKLSESLNLFLKPYYSIGLGKITRMKDLAFNMDIVGIDLGLTIMY